jgi:hypothetical protein
MDSELGSRKQTGDRPLLSDFVVKEKAMPNTT